MMKFWILTIMLAIFIGSCCTKRGCPDGIPPKIILKYEGFNSGIQGILMLLILNKDNGTATDSMQISPVYELSDWNLRAKGKNLRDFNFVVRTPQYISDTIKNISFTEEKKMMNCNGCTWSDASDESTFYNNFSYQYKDQTLSADTLLIYK